jgi:hypothetical protein
MNYRHSFDPEDQQLDVIHGYLVRSYWAEGIPRAVVARAVANSLCVGAYDDEEQVGFARVVTDRATFAYLADVFVLEGHRGAGSPSRCSRRSRTIPSFRACGAGPCSPATCSRSTPSSAGKPIPHPDRLMVRDVPDIYTR